MDIYTLTRDKNNVCTACSEEAAELFGETVENMIGTIGFKNAQNGYSEQSVNECALARENGTHVSTQFVYVGDHWRIMALHRGSPDGETVHMSAYDMSPQVDPHGVLKHVDQKTRTIYFPNIGMTISETDFIILNRHLRGWKQARIAKEINRSKKTVEHWLSVFNERSQTFYPGLSLLEAFRKGGTLWVMVTRDTWFLERRKEPRARTRKK